MKFFKILTLLFVSIFMLRCTTTSSVITDYDRDADFSQYETYYWSDEFQLENGQGEREPLFYNTLMKKRLKQAIQDEMEGRGYTLSSDNPELLINAQVVVQEKSNDRDYFPSYYYGFYRPYYNNTSGSDKEGDIVIDLIDHNQHQLVWQGYAQGVLDTNTKNRVEEIRAAVSLIFSEYGRRAGEDRVEEINR